jgi:predicted PhzF superfamily epimerase YddE/YHI9
VDLRWFTPTVEVDLCGHATLASTHVLGSPACFHTRSGPLSCAPAGDGWIEMDFPALEPTVAAADERLLRAIGTTDVYTVATSRFDLLVELGSADAVRSLQPDLGALRTLGPRGVIVTAPGDEEGIDMVSRFFAPGAGIDEDPVTGSAHCVLAPFWAARTVRTTLTGQQASKRGGLVRMRLDGDRVHLGGKAVTVWSGHLHAEPPPN